MGAARHRARCMSVEHVHQNAEYPIAAVLVERVDPTSVLTLSSDPFLRARLDLVAVLDSAAQDSQDFVSAFVGPYILHEL